MKRASGILETAAGAWPRAGVPAVPPPAGSIRRNAGRSRVRAKHDKVSRLVAETKLTSFNTQGGGIEQLADVTAVSYTLTGKYNNFYQINATGRDD